MERVSRHPRVIFSTPASDPTNNSPEPFQVLRDRPVAPSVTKCAILTLVAGRLISRPLGARQVSAPMVTLLLLACYLPLGLIPALLPSRVLRPAIPIFPALSLAPLTSAALALLLAQPLTNWLGYAVVLIPLLITLISLTLAVVGVRLTLIARREGGPIARLAISSILAGMPFALAVPFLVSAALRLVVTLVNRSGT